MCTKVKTYQDKEPYLVLDEIRKLFYNALREFDLKKIGEENKIDNTVKTLIMLSLRLIQLCESILSCGYFYAAAIIYRAMIEHSFKHIYLFKCCIKKGDDVAKEYQSDCMQSELLQKELKALRPNTIKPTDEFRKFKKKLDETSEKFKFSKILGSVFGRSSEDELQKMLRTLAVQYSLLSSYVHAGPVAVLTPEESPKKHFDMGSVLLTVIACRDTIHLLSLYPSAYQDELKALHKKMDKKTYEALEICEKNYDS